MNVHRRNHRRPRRPRRLRQFGTPTGNDCILLLLLHFPISPPFNLFSTSCAWSAVAIRLRSAAASVSRGRFLSCLAFTMRSSVPQARWEVGKSGNMYGIEGSGEGESIEAGIVPGSCACLRDLTLGGCGGRKSVDLPTEDEGGEELVGTPVWPLLADGD